MESFIRSPEPLKDNKPATWIIWKEEFLIFMELIGYMSRAQSFKTNLFKNLIGPIGLETINKLSFEHTDDKNNLDVLLKKIDNYYNPQQTEAQKRYKFFTSKKRNDETMENYIQNLKERAKDCNFGSITDSLIRDVIILHTQDQILRQKYIQEEKLNCDKIIDIYKNHKIDEHESKIKHPNVKSSDNVKPNNNISKFKHSKEENRKKEVLKQKESVNVTSTQANCWRCHTKHPMKQCPAWNNKCTKCNMLHHFEKCCRDSLQNTEKNQNMNNLGATIKKYMKGKEVFYNDID